ncbi:hypothetical protein [Lewinella sp. 4G2]|uniref:hypothetical protein n=1 Tax=Lewinella sp. 4G2 TaxID=1803372 RepID=UPI0007B48EF0|nr:hypothetical protein [Lewinella sp. 4G2]OAV46161.1 hypothetical protein A3850_018040 [Lewinella sp. 4G2]
MHPVQKHLMETEFSGLEGTAIEGTIALSDELINLGIMEALAKLKAAGQETTAKGTTEAAGTQAAAQAEDAEIDPKIFLKKLNVDKLHYRTENGRMLVDIKANFG